jgi:hypothetical protein
VAALARAASAAVVVVATAVAADADRRHGGDTGFVLGVSPMLTSARPHPLLVGLLLFALPSLAADPAPAPVLHRSSLAAVLAQRGALQLTPDQVKALEQADARLAREQDGARAARAHGEGGPGGDQPGSPPGGAPGRKPGGPSSGGPGGAAGGKGRPTPRPPTGPSPAEQLEQELDALDTQAFLKALEGLPESQREKVTDVASRHRELVFEQRERERTR